MKRPTIFIAGAGGIGQAAALILCENKPIMDCSVIIGDINETALKESMRFVKEGVTINADISTFLMKKDGGNEELDAIAKVSDVILDCLPGALAPKMAKLALDHGCHYANLTEYVAETNQIMEMTKDAETAFVLQTGLAPGFINILACQLYNRFKNSYKNDQLDKMTMKVGAVTRHASPPHYYAFTWSPIGVATEYLKDAIVVRDYQTTKVPALSGLEKHIINGITYEDNYTSGGAADLPTAFAGKIKDLDYKTLRLPGHYDWVKEQIKSFSDQEDKIQKLESLMLNTIPTVEDDLVVVYASVEGKDHTGRLRKIEKVYEVPPTQVGNQILRAIQATTAAPLCEMARIMVLGDYKGTVLQSQIEPDTFIHGPYVSQVYGNKMHHFIEID